MKKNNVIFNKISALSGGDLLLKALNKGLNSKVVVGSILAQPQLIIIAKEFSGYKYYSLGLETGGVYLPLQMIAEGGVWTATKHGGGPLRKSGSYSSQISLNGEECTPRACREILLGCYAEEIEAQGLPPQDEGGKKTYSLNKGVTLIITVDKVSTVTTLGFVARGERPSLESLKDIEVVDLSVEITEEEEEVNPLPLPIIRRRG